MEEKERAKFYPNNGKNQTQWTPIVMNAFSLQHKINNNAANTQGIAIVATDNRAPGPKPYATLQRYEGKITLWTSWSGTNWVPNKSLAESLKTLRKTSIIQRADVRLIKPLNAGKMLLKSIDRLIKTGLLIDWLLLKCEATNITFTKVHEEVEIYSVNDFKALKHIISQSTCLPLPFIFRDPQLGIRYFFINFKQAVNSRISKLNSRVFYDGNKEVLVTCDYGIRLDESYFQRIKKFRFHVGKTLVAYVTKHMLEIKRLIVYNHILFGYLQDWIKHLHLDFCKNYSLENIASSLSLHRISLSDVQRLSEGRNQVFFVTAVSDFALYVRFTPSSQSGQFTFEIDNIETPIVSTCSIVQFYRQFFYINDESKTNALECLLDYSLNKTFLQVSDVIEYRPGLIKTRTVEEINKMIDEQVVPGSVMTGEVKTPISEKVKEKVTGEAEEEIIVEKVKVVEKVEKPPVNEDSVIKLINCSMIDKETLKNNLLPFVKQSLEGCYAKNPVEILYEDETTDTNVMVHKFQEAFNRADKSSSFHSFLEHVYHSLQLSFTNATCQKIMNCMIYKELENRYTENSEEPVGVKELKETLKKPEAPTKMPTLMPLKRFLQLEKDKDVSKFKLKPCSVILKKIKVEETDKDFMLKLPKNSSNKKRKLSESEESVRSDVSSAKYHRKSQKFWDDEKLFRECLTSKTSVVLHKLEDTMGFKNWNKEVKLGKKEKLTSCGSDASSVNDVVLDCFEIADGKIKLKPGFECRDGFIVPVPDSTSSSKNWVNIPGTSVDVKPEKEKDTVVIDDADDIEILTENITKPKPKPTSPAKVPCGACSKVFKTVADLKEHEKLSHSNEKTYKCSDCMKSFYHIHFLDFHKMRIHENTYFCKFCKVDLQNDMKLEDHVITEEHKRNRVNYVEDIID